MNPVHICLSWMRDPPFSVFSEFFFFCFSFSFSSLKPHWGLNSKNRNQFKALWGKFVILSYMNKTEWEFFDSFIHYSIYSWFSPFLFLRIYLVLELLKASCVFNNRKMEWINLKTIFKSWSKVIVTLINWVIPQSHRLLPDFIVINYVTWCHFVFVWVV